MPEVASSPQLAGMAVRKAPAGTPDQLQSRATSRCHVQVLSSKSDNQSTGNESSPFRVMSYCASSRPFLLLLEGSFYCFPSALRTARGGRSIMRMYPILRSPERPTEMESNTDAPLSSGIAMGKKWCSLGRKWHLHTLPTATSFRRQVNATDARRH